MTQYIDPEGFAAAVADAVEARRWERRISSVRQLAEMSDMTHTYLGKRLNGSIAFDVEDLAKIGNALGVTPDQFIDQALIAMARQGLTQEHPMPWAIQDEAARKGED